MGKEMFLEEAKILMKLVEEVLQVADADAVKKLRERNISQPFT
jgi:hypothetical protein